MKPNRKHNAIRLFEVLGSDSGLITSISGQKKNSNRFSIFVNDTFVVGVSDSCLVNLNLHKGDVFDQEILDKIQHYEEQLSVREYFFRLLSRRDHATSELRQKAIMKGYNVDFINKICNDLESKGYINNSEFAKKFARDKFEFNSWGSQKIRIELSKKGIHKNDIQAAIYELDSKDQNEKMNQLFEKSKSKFLRTDKQKRKKKIFDFFLRKGYDSDQILKALPKWLTELDT